MKDKQFKKITDKISKNLDTAETLAKENYKLQESIVNSLKEVNEYITSKQDLNHKEISPLLVLIKDKLRRIEFDSVWELESEKEIVNFDLDKISKKKDEALKSQLHQRKWEEMFSLLKEFMLENQHCCLKLKDLYKNKPLGKWVDTQRKEYKKGSEKHGDNFNKLEKLSVDDNIIIKNDLLSKNTPDLHIINTIKFEWSSSDANWSRYYRQMKKFYVENKHSLVPSNHSVNCGNEKLELGTWVLRMRQTHRDSLLSTDRVNKLKAIYFCFSTDLNSIIKNESERNNLIELMKSINNKAK